MKKLLTNVVFVVIMRLCGSLAPELMSGNRFKNKKYTYSQVQEKKNKKIIPRIEILH